MRQKKHILLFSMLLAFPISFYISYRLYIWLAGYALSRFPSMIPPEYIEEMKQIAGSFHGFLKSLSSGGNLQVFLLIFVVLYIPLFFAVKAIANISKYNVKGILKGLGLSVYDVREELPEDIVKSIVLNMGESMEASSINYLKGKFYSAIEEAFKKNPLLSETHYIEGIVCSNINFHRNGKVTFKVRGISGQQLQIYAPYHSVLKSHVAPGDIVGIKGNLHLYDKAFVNGFEFLQFKAMEIRNIKSVSSDRNPLFDFMQRNKIKQRLSFFFVKKFRIALITSQTSEAKMDIHNCLDKEPKFEIKEICVNLYNSEDIARAITEADSKGSYNAILIARGGTDRIDIFNEYQILNAIYRAKTLVISAIGHASSNPLSNIVSDISQDTPSAAANHLLYSYQRYKSFKKKAVIFLIIAVSILAFIKKNLHI